MTRASFYDHPELYDALFAPEPPVVEFYAEQARRVAGPVLEVGCGTGKILIPIAQRGAAVTGLDSSPAMLAQARAHADTAGAPVQLVQADMRDFELGQRFELLFVASNSLAHLSDLGSLRRFFAAARRHLTPQARLVFDVSNPELRSLARPAEERIRHGQVVHSQWGELDVEERSEYDAAAQVTRALWQLRSTGRGSAHPFELRLRSFFPCELQLLLECCGFALVQRFGDFNGAPFSATSPHQVCVCEVAG
jgi:SAM-dependent methyltransferase